MMNGPAWSCGRCLAALVFWLTLAFPHAECQTVTAPMPGQEPAPALAPSAAASQGGSNGTAAAGSSSGLLTVCVVPWEPIAMCDSAATSYAAANFSGHDVQLVRRAAAKMGLQEGKDFVFRCSSFSSMVSSLTDPRGPCSAAASAITITSEREAQGIKFSYPYYKSSLSTLVQASQSSGSGWGFTRPFSWDLWVALLLTLLVFPPLVFLIEFLSLRKRIHRGDVVPGVVESGWRSAITLMLMDSFAVTSQGARIAVLCFCFLALLTTSTYTANLAAFVTVNTIRSRIDNIGDLRGRAVGTSPIYIDRLQKYGIQGIPYPLQNGSDYLTWRDLVATGQLAALVRDTPALEWLANTAPLCNVAVLPEKIEPFDYGIAFHKNTSEALVDAWSSAILKLQEDGTLQQLKDTWIVNPSTGCLENMQVNKNAQAVSFSDLYGLWIILGAGLALGCCTMLAQRCLRRHRKQLGPSRHSSSSAGLPLSTGGPLPNEHQPLRLLTSALSFGRLRSGRLRVGGRRGGQHRRSGGGSGSGSAAAAAKDASVEAASAYGDTSCDLESVPSFSQRGEAPVAPSTAAGTPCAVSASRQQARQAASPAAGGSAGGEQPMHRMSSLQEAASIYSDIHWKSPRSSNQVGFT